MWMRLFQDPQKLTLNLLFKLVRLVNCFLNTGALGIHPRPLTYTCKAGAELSSDWGLPLISALGERILAKSSSLINQLTSEQMPPETRQPI